MHIEILYMYQNNKDNFQLRQFSSRREKSCHCKIFTLDWHQSIFPNKISQKRISDLLILKDDICHKQKVEDTKR